MNRLSDAGVDMSLQTPDAAGPEPSESARVAVVVSHPIQYFCPQYASHARLAGVELRVFFASRHGLDAYHDRNFGRSVRWQGLTLDFPHEFLPGAANRAVTATIDAPAVGERLAAFGPRVLVVHGYGQRLARRALAWARRSGVPVAMFSDSELRQRRPWIRRALKALVLPPLLRRVDRFLTASAANEAYLRRYGVPDERFVRCPYPLDVRSLDRPVAARESARAAIRREHGIPDDHHVLLMVGKLAPWKRQRDLIAAAARLERTPAGDVTVLLAGSGVEEPALRALAGRPGAGRVVFAGFVQPRLLGRYYCAADVCVHCAEREPYGVAVAEAAYVGLPLVVADRCGAQGPTDAAQPGVNACVYPSGDIPALAAALERLLASPERRAAMGRASRRIGQDLQRRSHGAALLETLDSLGIPGRSSP